MKKRLLCMLCGLMFWVGRLSGDVIPEHTHYVERQVMVTNLSAFPEVVLVAYVTGPMIASYEVALIQENVPLNKGYKFNQLRVFALKKSALDDKGGLAAINFQRIAATRPPAEILDPAGTYVDNESPLIFEAHYYRIQQVTAAVLTLKLERSLYRYNNGAAERVVTY